jgi:hypothetical protein
MKRSSNGVRNTQSKSATNDVGAPQLIDPETAESLREAHAEVERIGLAFLTNPVKAFLETEQVSQALDGASFSAKDYARAVVDLANRKVVNWRLVDGLSIGAVPKHPRFFKQSYRADDSLVDRLKPLLKAIVDDRSAAARAFAPRLAELSRELVAVMRFRQEPKMLRIEPVLLPSRPGAAIDYGIALLMAGQPEGSHLCYCHLPTCEKFFFAHRRKTSGLVRTKYCTEDHMAEAHKAGNAERLRRFRKRRAKAEGKQK